VDQAQTDIRVGNIRLSFPDSVIQWRFRNG
jgi:hypothetical protein